MQKTSEETYLNYATAKINECMAELDLAVRFMRTPGTDRLLLDIGREYFSLESGEL